MNAVAMLLLLLTVAVAAAPSAATPAAGREECDKFHFQCVGEAKCIPLPWACNGQQDCSDNSDETGCNVAEVKSLEALRHKMISAVYMNPFLPSAEEEQSAQAQQTEQPK